MIKSLGLKAAAAALAFALVGGAAATQLMAQDAAKAATGTKTPAKKAAKKATTPSPCAGLEEAACKGNTACTWYKETTTKKGTKRKAHCQKKPTPPAKKAK
jgi:hypothetical protein